jgi:hypothetical protein
MTKQSRDFLNQPDIVRETIAKRIVALAAMRG